MGVCVCFEGGGVHAPTTCGKQARSSCARWARPLSKKHSALMAPQLGRTRDTLAACHGSVQPAPLAAPSLGEQKRTACAQPSSVWRRSKSQTQHQPTPPAHARPLSSTLMQACWKKTRVCVQARTQDQLPPVTAGGTQQHRGCRITKHEIAREMLSLSVWPAADASTPPPLFHTHHKHKGSHS